MNSLLNCARDQAALPKVVGIRNKHSAPRYSTHFRYGLFVILDMMQDTECTHNIDGPIGKRQCQCIAFDEFGVGQPPLSSNCSQFLDGLQPNQSDRKPLLLEEPQASACATPNYPCTRRPTSITLPAIE